MLVVIACSFQSSKMGTEGKCSFQLIALVTLSPSFEKLPSYYHMEQGKMNLDFSIYM